MEKKQVTTPLQLGLLLAALACFAPYQYHGVVAAAAAAAVEQQGDGPQQPQPHAMPTGAARAKTSKTGGENGGGQGLELLAAFGGVSSAQPHLSVCLSTSSDHTHHHTP